MYILYSGKFLWVQVFAKPRWLCVHDTHILSDVEWSSQSGSATGIKKFFHATTDRLPPPGPPPRGDGSNLKPKQKKRSVSWWGLTLSHTTGLDNTFWWPTPNQSVSTAKMTAMCVNRFTDTNWVYRAAKGGERACNSIRKRRNPNQFYL